MYHPSITHSLTTTAAARLDPSMFSVPSVESGWKRIRRVNRRRPVYTCTSQDETGYGESADAGLYPIRQVHTALHIHTQAHVQPPPPFEHPFSDKAREDVMRNAGMSWVCVSMHASIHMHTPYAHNVGIHRAHTRPRTCGRPLPDKPRGGVIKAHEEHRHVQ